MFYLYKYIKQHFNILPECRAGRPSLCFHSTDYLIHWRWFQGKGHGPVQLWDAPSALGPGHVNSLGLVYDFLTDSSASLLTELPIIEVWLYVHKWYNKIKKPKLKPIRIENCFMMVISIFFQVQIVPIFPRVNTASQITRYNI